MNYGAESEGQVAQDVHIEHCLVRYAKSLAFPYGISK